jgi:predicted RNA-binding protein with PUA-like domain
MSTVGAFHGIGVHNYGASAAEMRDGVMVGSLKLFLFSSLNFSSLDGLCS